MIGNSINHQDNRLDELNHRGMSLQDDDTASIKSYGSHKNRPFKDESHKGSAETMDGEEKRDVSKEDLGIDEGEMTDLVGFLRMKEVFCFDETSQSIEKKAWGPHSLQTKRHQSNQTLISNLNCRTGRWGWRRRRRRRSGSPWNHSCRRRWGDRRNSSRLLPRTRISTFSISGWRRRCSFLAGMGQLTLENFPTDREQIFWNSCHYNDFAQ